MASGGLWIGDIHMSNRLPYARPTNDGRTDRLEDQLAMWCELGIYAHKNNVTHVFVSGDLFDKAVLDPVTLTETTRALAKLAKSGLMIYILPGNHDTASIRGGRFNVEALDSLENVRCVAANEMIEHGDLLVHCVPYADRDSNIETIRAARELVGQFTDMINVLWIHNSVLGCKHLAWICDEGLDPEFVREGFDWTIAGHFHTHQKFGKDKRGMYLGAPQQHNFADQGETRGFWHIDFKSKQKRVAKLIPVSTSPSFHVVEVNGDDPQYGMPAASRPGDYVRWIVKTTKADFERMRDDVLAAVRSAEEAGLRADYKHEVVYHHKSRLQTAGSIGHKITMEQMIAKYMEHDDVSIGELDRQVLLSEGASILQEAQARRRNKVNR